MSVRNNKVMRFHIKRFTLPQVIIRGRPHAFRANLPYYTHCRNHRRYTRSNGDACDDPGSIKMVRRLFRILK